MKNYIILIFCTIVLIIACSKQNTLPSNKVADNSAIAKNDTIRIANDSLEYEVIIIDIGFNTWLASRARPRGYYGQSYLENKNRFWVTEWNNRAMNPQRFGELYQMQIDYQSQINYGYEVNYLLYNYLVFFQQTNNQKLGGIVPQ
jgi:hypothetical protein